MADERGQPVEAIRGYIQQGGASNVLKARIQEKTLDWLLENAKVTKVAPKEAEAADVALAADAAEATSGAAANWNKSMKKGELLEVAKGLGLKVTTKMTSPNIEALENA